MEGSHTHFWSVHTSSILPGEELLIWSCAGQDSSCEPCVWHWLFSVPDHRKALARWPRLRHAHEVCSHPPGKTVNATHNAGASKGETESPGIPWCTFSPFSFLVHLADLSWSDPSFKERVLPFLVLKHTIRWVFGACFWLKKEPPR